MPLLNQRWGLFDAYFFFIQAVFFALALRHANNKKDKAENMENV